MKKFIFIVDALRSDYAQTVRNILKDGDLKFRTVVPPFSFEPDAAYMCGKYPEETDSGTRHWLKSDVVPTPFLEKFSFILPGYNFYYRKLFNRFIRLAGFNFFGHFENSPAFIPLKLVGFFDVCHEENFYAPDIRGKNPTIYNRLAAKGVLVRHFGVPHQSGRLENIKTDFSRKNKADDEVLSFFISDLDSLGHKFGAGSAQYQEGLSEIFEWIRGVVKRTRDSGYECDYVVFGDHGMVDVISTVNIEKILSKLGLRVGLDFIYFLDSTLARFWFMNDRAKRLVFDSLSDNTSGAWVDEKDVARYRIAYKHNRFGDLIWWCHGGIMISPNFWQGKKKINGMHGYREGITDNHTMICGDFDYGDNRESLSMIDVNSILLDFLELV